MKLVPYFFTHPKGLVSSGHLACLWIFLASAGKRLWQTEEPRLLCEEEIVSSYCEPNGLIAKRISIEKDIAFVEVDSQLTSLKEFYLWEEALQLPSKPECWKRIVLVYDSDSNLWWSGKGIVDAEIPELGSLEELLARLKEYHEDTVE